MISCLVLCTMSTPGDYQCLLFNHQLGQVLTDIHKELNLIKLKTAQLVEKQSQYRKMTRDYDELNKQVKSDHRSYLATHKQLREISHTIEHIK